MAQKAEEERKRLEEEEKKTMQVLLLNNMIVQFCILLLSLGRAISLKFLNPYKPGVLFLGHRQTV